MKKVILLLVLALMFTGCLVEDPTKVSLSEESSQSVADKLVANLVYFKDPRTGICFVNSGHVTIPIPEEKIPKDILITAKVVKGL